MLAESSGWAASPPTGSLPMKPVGDACPVAALPGDGSARTEGAWEGM